jgi:hypothetical protein
MVNCPYLLLEDEIDINVRNNSGDDKRQRFRLHRPHIRRRFGQLESLLTAYGALHQGRLGAADCRILNIPRFRDAMLPVLIDDPLFLLAADERRRWHEALAFAMA